MSLVSAKKPFPDLPQDKVIQEQEAVAEKVANEEGKTDNVDQLAESLDMERLSESVRKKTFNEEKCEMGVE